MQVQPNDFDFRFQLAYAYSQATGGYAEHNYRDLALFHYQLLVRRDAGVEYAQNNLGATYNSFQMPIHATEEFKADSEKGNALATANVVRQYLNAGFVEAKAWAETHEAKSDPDGDVAQALATAHSLRAAENVKIAEILANERQHRSALASFASPLVSGVQSHVDGEWAFPLVNLRFTLENGKIIGAGESSNAGGKILHSLDAVNRSGLWRIQMTSRKESDYSWSSSEGRSFGLFEFSVDGRSLSVLEYGPSSSSIAVYTVSKIESRVQQS